MIVVNGEPMMKPDLQNDEGRLTESGVGGLSADEVNELIRRATSNGQWRSTTEVTERLAQLEREHS
jgi:hypothetical protein